MRSTARWRQVVGHVVAWIGVVTGLGLGLLTGLALPAAPWLGGLVAASLAATFGSAGVFFAGDLVASSCPCCEARTVTGSWQRSFQCWRCQTTCALATLKVRSHLRTVRAAR